MFNLCFVYFELFNNDDCFNIAGKEKQNINMEQFRMTRTNRLQRLYDNTWLWQDINIGFVFSFSFDENC